MTRLKIGISACFMHKDPTRALFKGKTLLYVEESLVHWVMRLGAQAFVIPSVAVEARVALREYADELDGLVLHGGADVAPESYGEKPLKDTWQGDRVRDLYEIELFKAFKAAEKPILGVCRGAQIINVALGGTLYQDIATQVGEKFNHRDWNIYDNNFHDIDIAEGSYLAKIFGSGRHRTNSIHHQALKDLGENLTVEAVAHDDKIIEGIKFQGVPYICGVQWHPEFHDDADSSLLSGDALLKDFMQECEVRRSVLRMTK